MFPMIRVMPPGINQDVSCWVWMGRYDDESRMLARGGHECCRKQGEEPCRLQ
jgi:hypothetical protein